jgi:type II secretory pathway predicted ATPase ExeA
MSESFFGLRKRPFAALPDADCFVPLEGVCQAFDGLLQAAAEGRGIGVLTAPAGLGKTLVCQRLARELCANFRVVALPTGNFLTRRSLLQAILFDLGHSFVRMGDQELRLALAATLQSIRPARRGLVLIVDEAHLLATRMLEELRALLSFGEAGEPLVRLVVSGHLSLEETLSRPECDAFNQRIACQVMLPTLTREESSSYLTRRLAWAGVNVSEVFTRESLTAICEAADGVPRCLHQLADHCLTLATNRGEKPITFRTVREALDHLKQLPLAWAEPTISRPSSTPLEMARAQAAAALDASGDLNDAMARHSIVAEKSNRPLLGEAFFDTYPLQADYPQEECDPVPQAAKSTWELDSSAAVIAPWIDDEPADHFDEVAEPRTPIADRADIEFEDSDQVRPETANVDADLESASLEMESSVDLELTHPANNDREETTQPQRPGSGTQVEAMSAVVDEEVVIDRYAALDSALNRLTRTMLNVRANARRKAAEATIATTPASAAPLPIETVETVHQRFDIVMPEDEPADEPALVKSGANATSVAQQSLTGEPVAASAVAAVGTPVGTGSSGREPAPRTTTDERRPYQLLFSELRRRRRRV